MNARSSHMGGYTAAALGHDIFTEGDTLEAIALRLWGDASFWYMIADANGLSGSETLVAGQTLRTLTLGELTPEQVDMRTMVLIGSSTTCTFPRAGGGEWVYTPRWYGAKPAS